MSKEELNELKEDYSVFTFGGGHYDECGRSLGNVYVVVHGNFNEARALMAEARGNKWAFQYSSKEEAGVERFGLVEMTLEQVYIEHHK